MSKAPPSPTDNRKQSINPQLATRNMSAAPQQTDNRQQTTDNRQPTTDNRQQITDNGQQRTDNSFTPLSSSTRNRQQKRSFSSSTRNPQPATGAKLLLPQTDNRQQTTDNRQQTTDNRQQITDNRFPQPTISPNHIESKHKTPPPLIWSPYR